MAGGEQDRWNARYRGSAPSYVPHPLVTEALARGFPDGPVLDLACGRSGSALALAEAGRRVVGVDVSDIALAQLEAEAARRGLSDRVVPVVADLDESTGRGGLGGLLARAPGGGAEFSGPFALVLATLFWDAAVFRAAQTVLLPGGLLGWEALAADEPGRRYHVRPGQPRGSLLGDWSVLTETVVEAGARRSTRLLARRLW